MMSPRPMRRYVPPRLVCARCERWIRGEVRMVNGELYHPTCAPKPEPPRPVYRVRSRGRVEVRTPGGNWQRVRAIPANSIRWEGRR